LFLLLFIYYYYYYYYYYFVLLVLLFSLFLFLLFRFIIVIIFIIIIITIWLPVRYFWAMVICSSWFVHCLIVQDYVLGITLCFDGFMWIYCDSPGCMKARIWLCFMYDHVILCTWVQLNDMKVYLHVMDTCFVLIECLV